MPLDTREAFRQKTVDDFLVAAGDFVGPAASNSTGNDETQQGEAEAAYLTAPAAASPAGDAAIEKAFWSVFADDVMEHLVWPAVHKRPHQCSSESGSGQPGVVGTRYTANP